ncbi:DUF4178 domain-containing protein [Aquincola sp. MAHUQ-54]|uniref:DUF4178 domain-containing protein n=1 Tax=Aquincola agrisoli TaxID=3119538 RepID=A0AAW9QHZ8_9BURK
MTGRTWRAACPSCGAPVDFQSAASASAVCSYCRSTLVRDGEALRRIGQSAELFDDHTPLQLGAAGRYQGEPFTLLGRLQMAYEGGTWNEWHALFDNGRTGWLSEDNGAYVLAFDAPVPADAPQPGALRAGERRAVGGQAWEVASVQRAKLLAAQGELPAPPPRAAEFTVADLRSTRGEVATLDDADPARLGWSVGRAVALAELSMTGLSEESEKTLRGRSFECPHCGAPLTARLASTQSMVCGQCKAVVDLSAGVGADLAHYTQAQGHLDGGQPQIPLGSTGTLALGGEALPWQVVGYVERAELPEEAEDEQTFWREYLLYHRSAGFAFLVDADDGWSWARPITGVPERVGEHVKQDGVQYKPLYTYTGTVTYVLGEFYWRLQRDERTRNTDYRGLGAHARKRLNREAAGSEVTWSAGEALEAATVARAFRLPDDRLSALQRDTLPLGGGSGAGLLKPLLIFGLLVVIIVVLTQCGGDDCDELRSTFGAGSNEYRQCLQSGGGGTGMRTGGGAFGGFSTGGGHK